MCLDEFRRDLRRIAERDDLSRRDSLPSLPEGGAVGFFGPISRGPPSGRRESNAFGGTVARRTNYGFEKEQRERKKQKLKQEKAERRRREEASTLVPENGEAADEAPPASEPPDQG
jgi:hypothetical protein